MTEHRARDCDDPACPRHPAALFAAHGVRRKADEDDEEEARPLSPEEEAEVIAESDLWEVQKKSP